MKSHKKKMIAPILITAIVTIYYIAYFLFLFSLSDGFWRYALGIIPLAVVGVMVKVCIERVREIKEGEEDDIGKY